MGPASIMSGTEDASTTRRPDTPRTLLTHRERERERGEPRCTALEGVEPLGANDGRHLGRLGMKLGYSVGGLPEVFIEDGRGVRGRAHLGRPSGVPAIERVALHATPQEEK